MIGTAVVRTEDPRLLTGRGTYVDDLAPPGAAHMAFVRSDRPHARIIAVDAGTARAGSGVLGVWAAASDGELSPVQQGFRACHGLQCGYCTPGMVMSATGLLLEDPAPDEHAIRKGIEGNLCRCTGYQTIVEPVCWAADHGGARVGPAAGASMT